MRLGRESGQLMLAGFFIVNNVLQHFENNSFHASKILLYLYHQTNQQRGNNMAITYKQVNVLHEFKASNMDICIKVWEQLVGKGERILVSYRTNMDDPRDVTFVVGATDNNNLHEFILKHAGTLCLLGEEATEHLMKYYLHGNRGVPVIPGPKGTEPVKYYELDQVRDGNERNSSWWYDCTYDRTFTKKDIIDNKFGFTLHKFVKVRD